MDGKALAARIRAEVAEAARELGEIGLTTVLVGDDPASEIYIGLKHGAATAAGIRATDLRFPSTTSQAELREILDAWFAGEPSGEADDRANVAHVSELEQSG